MPIDYQPALPPIKGAYDGLFFRHLNISKDLPPEGLEKVEVILPPDERRINTVQDETSFMHELVEMIRQKCADPTAAWARNPQFTELRDFAGFATVERYLGGGQLRLRASAGKDRQPPKTWIVVALAGGPFGVGDTFEQ